jgi:hypothetical protein
MALKHLAAENSSSKDWMPFLPQRSFSTTAAPKWLLKIEVPTYVLDSNVHDLVESGRLHIIDQFCINYSFKSAESELRLPMGLAVFILPGSANG